MKRSERCVRPILPAVLVLAVALAGCGLFSGGPKRSESSAPAPSSSEEPQAPSAAAGTEAGASVPDASPQGSSSGAESAVSGTQTGPVLPITTDNPEFDRKFQGNPLDRAYIAESGSAFSAVQMVDLSGRYAQLWKKEVSHAYAQLAEALKGSSASRLVQAQKEQKDWESGTPAALRKIAQKAQSAGGSMAQVEEAGDVMDYYRARAARLYLELYAVKPDFSYAFQP